MMSIKDNLKNEWTWSQNKLVSVREIQEAEKKKNVSRHVSKIFKRNSPGNILVQFFDNIDGFRQREYCQNYLRQNKIYNLLDVITLQDIKNVVTFTAVGKVPVTFIRLFHSKLVDKFLISLIAYFEIFLEVLADLKWRDTFKGEMLKHPIAKEREKYCMKSLNNIRCRVGQEYSAMLVGIGKLTEFHHVSDKVKQSQSIKDIIIYEYLYKFASRTVWIALNRRDFVNIEVEINYLFRTDKFRTKERQSDKSGLSILPAEDINNVLRDEIKGKCKMHLKSPAIKELFKLCNDYNFLNEHYTTLEEATLDKGVSYLNAIYIVPEELYYKVNLTLGILGLPREDYDLLLQLKEIIPDEDELSRLNISSVLTTNNIKASVMSIKPMYNMYLVLNRYENVIRLPPLIMLDDVKWEFTKLVQLVRHNQEEDSKKYIKLWKGYPSSKKSYSTFKKSYSTSKTN